ncbi:DUF6513 domain-containing protein [Zavarzinella formosa]|uniref:DUF6513 domain-containing protein n=1 Tax=Zavarzinella formosa TaxID=360055 RepID=UPI0002D79C7D|nr:DUF6513 domain-containing protein [Zavarzinella formosa]
MPKILFVTGKLAEASLRKVLADLAPAVGFEAEVAVMPITVAALLTTDWVGRRLHVADNTNRVILPGYCRGELGKISLPAETSIERGPRDLRDLPEFFGKRRKRPADYGKHNIDILAEINHAPTLSPEKLLAIAADYRRDGADLIDLGCDPGTTWTDIGHAVAKLREAGHRVSVDSFNPVEVEAALAAGAELVLSVNSSNRELAIGWHERHGSEVVAIPDQPTDTESLAETVSFLKSHGLPHRIDPILEPIGHGFAASLGRYLEARKRWPDTEIMMGVGNLTELTEVDSAGINTLLAGFCQETGIRSILTTQVINWCRTAVREFDLARRLMHHAVTEKTLPKHVDAGLTILREAKLTEQGEETLTHLASTIKDRNYRLFAERGELHVMNGDIYVRGADPFELFEKMLAADSKLDPAHSFYLGYELCKAVTALTLGKNYTQDQELKWGFLTVPEISHRNAGV